MTNAPKFPVPAHGYRAVYFDLDGTLLPMDLDEFLASYFQRLALFMVEKGANGEIFKNALNTGVKAMIKNDTGRANATVYWEVFFSELARLTAEAGVPNKSDEEWARLFEEFYEGPFGEVGAGVIPDENMVRAVRTLEAKGYPVVLATMPLFPLRALEWRCAWSGLKASDFVRLTTFDNSTAAKPSLHYYAENLAALGLAGEDVLMVGNNTVEDLAFANLGVDTYLVTDHILDPVDFGLDEARHGTSAEFAAWIEALPPCANPAKDVNPGEVDPAATAKFLEDNLVATPEQLAAAKEAARKSQGAADDVGRAIEGVASERAAGKAAASGEAASKAAATAPSDYTPVGMEEALAADFSNPSDIKANFASSHDQIPTEEAR